MSCWCNNEKSTGGHQHYEPINPQPDSDAGVRAEVERLWGIISARNDEIDEVKAELASWQRHGVKVTEDCETCDGSGEKPCDASIHKLDKDGIESHPCPDCGGTEKKLRDGAWRWNLSGEHGDEPTVLFPAEWLEAE